MMLMSTYGTLQRMGDEKDRTVDNTKVSFRYPELVYNHYTFRHAVDDHNNRRQAPISIERTWSTNWWPNRVFAFLLGVTEVNVYLAMVNIFKLEKIEQLEFRKLLTFHLIHNSYDNKDIPQQRQKRSKVGQNDHEMLRLPPFKKFSVSRQVKSKIKYPQAL